MTVSIIDGHVGRPHVTSDDLEATNVALYGYEKGVLPWGDQLACHMSDANHAVVSSGAGIVRGRRFVIHELETVPIESGTQAAKRHDLIVARYGKDAEGVESVALVVVRGEPGTTAGDPAIEEDDLPLWRIPLDGLNVGEPERMWLSTLPSLTAAGGSSSSGAYQAAMEAAAAANSAAASARAAAGIAMSSRPADTTALETTVDDLSRTIVTLTGGWLVTGGKAYAPEGKMSSFEDTLSLPLSTAAGDTITLG